MSGLKTSCLALAVAVAGVLPTLAAEAPHARPNILFAFADDWGYYASAYRPVDGGRGLNTVVQTPNFDRVARAGVLFTHAFVPAPSCTPCRSSILSGQYFYRTGLGAILQGARWDPAIPSYPLVLKAKGYHIGFTYKVWSPGQPANAPYGATAHAYAKAGADMNRFSTVVSKAADQEAKKQAIFKQVTDNFQQFLHDRKPGQPWCYWFGPTNTHRTFVKGSGKALWGIHPDDLKGKLPSFLPDNDVVREDMSDYLGEAQAFDAALGKLLDQLQATGELDNTLIVVSGDHGIGGMPRAKCNLYDFGTHVALAIRWGKHVPGGRVIDDFVNLMDLAPTFLEVAGEQPLPVMTGRSLLPVLTSTAQGQVDPARTFVITGRERHVAAARAGYLPYPHRALRTKDFLYIRNFQPDRWPMGSPETNLLDIDDSPTKAWYLAHKDEAAFKPYWELAFGKRPAEELYDLQKDPHQMTNVAGDAFYQQSKRQLSDQLLAELKRTGDPRVLGDGSTFDKPPYAGPLPEAPPASKPALKKDG